MICLLAASGLPAQLSVRPEDPSGLSLRLPRVQLIHSERPDLPGTSMHLQQTDPWLAYAIGHEYFEHEWSRREGVFKSLAQRGAAGTVNSCAMCHNAPFRSAGFGGTVFDPPGPGRRVPHLFGIGLVEMIGFQIRQKILAQYDTNHNGYLDVPSETAGRRARIAASPGVWVDFGSLDDLDGDGMPDLNELIKVTLVDRRGRPLPRRPDGTPSRLGDAAVAGFDIDVGVFSTAIGDHQFSSMRTFLKGVMNTVFGMRVVDPTAAAGEPDGWARVSNAGAPQRHFPLPPEEDTCPRFDRVSEGEVDLLEWYLLNHPPPGLARQDPSTIHGRRLLARYGCTTCHITDWTLEPQSTGGAGDRRFFDLEVSYSAPNHRLEG
ncbi:MAG TPA: hypothetical protein VN999_02345, partial [Thermoanaerobaculia bacterium]|nr:hypothetical protein [Thermoanaerobaculia bacterium]